jgi:hypothetical protein
MSKDVLIISTIDGAENCARVIEQQIGTRVELAPNRKAGLAALRRSEYGVVVVEQNLAEADPEWADQVWAQAGLAMPIQINFAISGSARLSREVKAALTRRANEEKIARRAIAAEMENSLKSSVTGLLLESELALREPTVPASLEPKLRHLVELAGALRERLCGPSESRL